MARAPDEQYSEEEAQRRFEEALRTGMKMPAKPHQEMKLGRRKKKPESKPSSSKRGASSNA